MNLEIFNNLSTESIKRYFEDTFLKVKVSPDSPFQYLKFKSVLDREPGYYVLSMRDSARTTVVNLNIAKIDFTLPEYGYYQLGDDAILFYRIPIRQYKKALSQECFGFSGLKQLYLNFLPPDMSQQVIKNFHSPDIWTPKKMTDLFLGSDEKPTLENKIMSIFKRKKFAYALNKNFALSQPLKSGKFPDLWFLSSLIGFMKTPQNVVISSPEFRQEVIDFFPPHITVE